MPAHSLKTFKKNFLNTFIAGILLLFSNFFFLYFVRVKFRSYLNQIVQYASEAQSLQQGLDAGTLTPYDANIFLDKFSGLTSNALLFGYFIVPLAILLLITFFSSIIFKQMSDGNMKGYWNYLKKFAIISIISGVIGFALFYPIFSSIKGLFTGFNPLMLLLAVLEMLLFYFTMMALSLLNDRHALKAIKAGLTLGMKKFALMFPLSLVLMLFIALLVGLFSILFTSFDLGTKVWLSMPTNIIYILLALAAALYFTSLFYLLAKKHSS